MFGFKSQSKKSKWSIFNAPLATLDSNIQRSSFDLSYSHLTTFNVGKLIPVYAQEVYPADTIKLNTHLVARTSTMLFPVMDTSFISYSFFFVPYRLLWEHWAQFMGESPDTPFINPTQYQIPQLQMPSGGWAKGTIGDYLTVTGVTGSTSSGQVSALPFRAVAKVYNDFFRDQNLQQGAAMPLGDALVVGTNGTDPFTDAHKGGYPLPVGKIQDYFTTCLPSPQKGAAVRLPLGLTAPVVTGDDNTVVSSKPIRFHSNSPIGTAGSSSISAVNLGLSNGGSTASNVGTYDNGGSTIHTDSGIGLIPTNLYTDLSTATAATINDLRKAFMTQQILEIDAIGGTRYTEMVQAHWGVTNPDARLQRAEFLGGKRSPMQAYQVAQTSATSGTGASASPQANLAAFGYTQDSEFTFEKSFTEHGIIIGFADVRPVHTYQYGVDRYFFRKDRFDFHFPTFNHLGEQPVYNREIFMDGTQIDNQVFGYQEAWADLRMRQNRISGAFRSQYAQSLDSWHYADKFSSRPVLNAAFIAEPLTNFDRTLAVQSSVEDQILFDIHFDVKATRALPTYSKPAGLSGRY